MSSKLLPIVLTLAACAAFPGASPAQEKKASKPASQGKPKPAPKTPAVGPALPSPFKGTKPPERSTTPDVPIEGRSAAERFRNLRAFLATWVPVQKAMHEKFRGRWIAIVAGKVFPRDKNDRPRPVASLAELDRLCRAAHPVARHRFVFRIGEEGDENVSVGMCELDRVLGGRVLQSLSKKWMIQAGGGFFVRWKGKWRDIGVKGPDKRSFASVAVATPSFGSDSKRAREKRATRPRSEAAKAKRAEPTKARRMGKALPFCYSNIFGGTLTLKASDVHLDELALWEIPGDVAISGLARKGRLRRVWLHCRFPSLDHEALLPAGVWLPKAAKAGDGTKGKR